MAEYERVVLLDGDMMIMRNMDDVFEFEWVGKDNEDWSGTGGIEEKKIEDERIQREGDWIAANHACVCNLTKADWAPIDWFVTPPPPITILHRGAVPNVRTDNGIPVGWIIGRARIAHTHQCSIQPRLPTPPPSPPHPTPPHRPRTHTLLNSGLVLLFPSVKLFERMVDYLYTSPLVATFSFPDQDFLAAFFYDRWRPIGWQYNAIKTARYEHAEMWRDEEVRNLHYIVEKPWAVGRGRGINGGRDAETHGWWWDAWNEMVKQWSKEDGEKESKRLVGLVGRWMGEEHT